MKEPRIFSKQALMAVAFGLGSFFSVQVKAELPVVEQLKALHEQSTDWLYGYSPTDPILLGGFTDDNNTMSKRIRDYFAWLSSPQEISVSAKDPTIHWRRMGSCCAFKTPNGPIDETGLLDIYEVIVPGERPIHLFVNHYDEGQIMAPSGFYLHTTNNWQKEWAPALAAYQKGAWQQAIDELKKLIATQQGKGNGLAEYLLQISFYNLKDQKQADEWLLKATDLKHPEALADIAIKIINYDPLAAEEMFKLASIKGSAFAALNLGSKILQENPGKARWLSAVFFLYSAAEHGEVGAQFLLAQTLHDEWVKPAASRFLKLHDPSEIMMWLEIANLSHPQSPDITQLIAQYAKDFSLTDLNPFETAAKNWQRTFQRPDFALNKYVEALAGNAKSQFDYGLLLVSGQVVPQDVSRATALLILSCQAKYPAAEQIFESYAGISCDDLNATNVSRIADVDKKKDVENGLAIIQAWIK